MAGWGMTRLLLPVGFCYLRKNSDDPLPLRRFQDCRINPGRKASE